MALPYIFYSKIAKNTLTDGCNSTIIVRTMETIS